MNQVIKFDMESLLPMIFLLGPVLVFLLVGVAGLLYGVIDITRRSSHLAQANVEQKFADLRLPPASDPRWLIQTKHNSYFRIDKVTVSWEGRVEADDVVIFDGAPAQKLWREINARFEAERTRRAKAALDDIRAPKSGPYRPGN